jgi:hypothetical protein
VSVYQARNGRWAAQISTKPKKIHVGTFDTEADARAAEAEALAGLPPSAPKPLYVIEDHGYVTPCWQWMRAKTPRGYGTISLRIDGTQMWMPAHRHYYELHKGPIPEGYQIDHLCRNHSCVNPEHLEAVTQAENMRRGANTRLTHLQVATIRASSASHGELAERFGVSADWIWKIRTGRAWRPDARTNRLAAAA